MKSPGRSSSSRSAASREGGSAEAAGRARTGTRQEEQEQTGRNRAADRREEEGRKILERKLGGGRIAAPERGDRDERHVGARLTECGHLPMICRASMADHILESRVWLGNGRPAAFAFLPGPPEPPPPEAPPVRPPPPSPPGPRG